VAAGMMYLMYIAMLCRENYGMNWSLQKAKSTGLILSVVGLLLMGLSIVYFTRQEFKVLSDTPPPNTAEKISIVIGMDILMSRISIAIMLVGVSLYCGSMYLLFRQKKAKADTKSA
jgi:hypothetical protein